MKMILKQKKEISYEKELNNDKERILTKETKEKNIEKKVKIMCKNQQE